MRCCLALLAVAATVGPAAAEDAEDFDASYLYDGGAIPFFYVPLAASIAIVPLLPPRERPIGFSPFEGGAPRGKWEVPTWAMIALGGVTVTAIAASGDDTRLYHAKGLSQAMATSAFVTSAMKYVFSRRRPHWHEKDLSADSRRSFPSGHATQAFAVGAYAILFLRGHVLADRSAFEEGLVYGGITVAATAFAAERVLNNRHYISDVAIGALLGTAASFAFYRYQQHRYDEAHGDGMSTRQVSFTLRF
jgi:membrane-associated phospholipid phosphatase